MGSLTVKESGEMINFISPNVSNITSFKVHFSPKQEGTGDPSPENVREITGWDGVEGYKCGKNMAHIFGYGTQNITDTDVNKYKTTNTYGTTINTTIFNNPDTPLIIEQSQAPNSTAPSDYQNGYIAIGTDNLIFGQKYNVSFKVSNITNNILNISLNDIKLLVPTGTTTKVTEIIDDVLIFKNITFYQNTTTPQRQGFEIRICGFSFTLSEFMVTSVDNEDFTYEPYQGTELNINWTNNIKQWTYTNSTFDTYSSNIFNGYANSLWDYAIENIPAEWFGKSLTYSVYIDRAESPYTPYDDVRVWFYGDSTTMKEASSAYRITEPSSSGRSWVTFTIPEGTTKLALGLLISKGSRAYNPQLEYGEEPTEYQPYVGDVYGGYVDLVSGELVATQKLLTITGNEDVTYTVYRDSIYTGSTLFLSDSEEIANTSMSIKGVCSFVSTQDGIINRNYLRKAYSDKGLQFYKVSEYWGLSEVTSEALVNKLQAWNNLGTPLQICYSLANPITVATLSPTQLSTLKGQNNFWSNADYIEIEYELTETFDIQKAKRKIILNQPHVESISGDIITFDTDIKSRLKECKVYFSPIQEGEGDPSPDNVREITGWNGVEGYIINVAQSYSSTFNTSTAAIDWTNDVGTVYGGYVDLVSGELIVNMAIVNLGTLTWTYNEQYTTFLSYPIDLMSTSTYKKGLCSQYRITNQWLTSQGWASGDKFFSLRGQDGRIRIKDTTYTDASAFKTSVDGVQFVYELADPIHYQLTPQQLTALRGTNIIYSNANGQIDIKYWIHFPKINYMKDVQWLDHSYITSAGKLTEESTALSHTTVNSILLPAGNYRIYGFCYQEPPANSLNCRVHEYSAGGSWIKLITSNAANTMSPYILEFSLDHDSYIKLSLPRLLDAKLIKI